MASRAVSAPFTPGDSPGDTPTKRRLEATPTRGPRPPSHTREEEAARDAAAAAAEGAAPPPTPSTSGRRTRVEEEAAMDDDALDDLIAAEIDANDDVLDSISRQAMVLRSTTRAGNQHTEVVRHPGLNTGLRKPPGESSAPGGTESAGGTETLTAATGAMDTLTKASVSVGGASPEDMVALLEELQRNPQLQQLVKSGIMSWDSLTKPNDGSVTLPDGTAPGRIIDYDRLLKLQKQLSVLAAKQAGALHSAVEVVVKLRTTPGPKAAVTGAFYPGLTVWMPPQSLPPRRPGGR